MTTETIEVNLGKEGGKKVFDTLKELGDWLTAERKFWEFLKPTSGWGEAPTARNLVWPRYDEFFNRVNGQVNEANKSPQQNLVQCILSIKGFFSTFYENGMGIFSGSPTAKFLKILSEEKGVDAAAFACAIFMNLQPNFQLPGAAYGGVAAVLFDSGIKKRSSSELEALKELRQSWEAVFQKFKENLQSESERHLKLNSETELFLTDTRQAYDKLITSQKQTLQDFVESRKKDQDDLIKNAKIEWDNLKKTYDQSLALMAPVTYWKRKACSHLILSWIFGPVSLLVVAAFFAVLVPEAKELLLVPPTLKDTQNWHPEYWRLALLIASGLFGVWIVRIFVRLFLSNVHLQADAKERETMILTYLALLRRGKLPGVEEKLFILESLFRPSTTGIMKDDAVPLTAVEALSKINK